MLLVIHNSFVNDWQENCGRRAALRKALLFFRFSQMLTPLCQRCHYACHDLILGSQNLIIRGINNYIMLSIYIKKFRTNKFHNYTFSKILFLKVKVKITSSRTSFTISSLILNKSASLFPSSSDDSLLHAGFIPLGGGESVFSLLQLFPPLARGKLAFQLPLLLVAWKLFALANTTLPPPTTLHI